MSRRLDYNNLVQKVLQIDRDAARYLLGDDVKALPVFYYSNDLDECFVFSDTPQGTAYWWNLHKKVLTNSFKSV